MTYDSLLKGLLDSSTRYVGGTTGKAYTKRVSAYDSMGRATSKDLILPSDDPLVTSGAVAVTSTFTTDYRIDGTVNNSKEPAAAGIASEIISPEYNSHGLPTGLSGSSSYLLGVDYSALGQAWQLTLGTSTAEGVKKAYLNSTFEEGTGRLLRSFVTDQTHPWMPQDLNYAYDPAGNVTSIFDPSTLGGTSKADYQCFSIDGQRRLTEAWTPKTADCATTGRASANLGGAAPYWSSYTYNTAGQRASETDHTPDGASTKATYCYSTSRPHAVTATTTAASCTGVAKQYEYDATGNTTQRVEKIGNATSQALAWNAEGKLSKLTEDTIGTDYLYDADGELLIRRKAGGETVLYLGATEVHTKGTKKWANRYYSVAGTTVALRSNETGTTKVTWLAADHHGTSSLALDSGTQAISKRYSGPFGTSRGTASGPWPDDKSFLGKPADTDTGLTHIGAREYDPTTGQFISVDPLLLSDQAQSLNGYAYGNNNPVTNADPTGLCAEPDCPTRPTPDHENTTPGAVPGPPKLSTGGGGGSGGTGGTGGTGGSGDGGGGGTGSVPPPITYVMGPAPLPLCTACLPIFTQPVVGPMSPEVLSTSYCASNGIDLACNPEDAVLGGGDDGFREVGMKWLLGNLEYSKTYGEDSEIAKQVKKTDLTAAHLEKIARAYASDTGKAEGVLRNSISDGDSKSQFKKDAKSLVTGDRNLATAALGSYTAKYKVLRASPKGVQARITIKNSMSWSSFTHIATGYGTSADRFVQRWFDLDGVIATRGALNGASGKVHHMEIVFRAEIRY
ncbi:RHS repeat-associated core domain-containing protein [Streptomyces flavidovirens]|uniref:RHS repeat domain-containing protein n=1 Tax=Streptomyces flavidovirens TaxID=67298 RepID=UPI0033B3AE7C